MFYMFFVVAFLVASFELFASQCGDSEETAALGQVVTNKRSLEAFDSLTRNDLPPPQLSPLPPLVRSDGGGECTSVYGEALPDPIDIDETDVQVCFLHGRAKRSVACFVRSGGVEVECRDGVTRNICDVFADHILAGFRWHSHIAPRYQDMPELWQEGVLPFSGYRVRFFSKDLQACFSKIDEACSVRLGKKRGKLDGASVTQFIYPLDGQTRLWQAVLRESLENNLPSGAVYVTFSGKNWALYSTLDQNAAGEDVSEGSMLMNKWRYKARVEQAVLPRPHLPVACGSVQTLSDFLKRGVTSGCGVALIYFPQSGGRCQTLFDLGTVLAQYSVRTDGGVLVTSPLLFDQINAQVLRGYVFPGEDLSLKLSVFDPQPVRDAICYRRSFLSYALRRYLSSVLHEFLQQKKHVIAGSFWSGFNPEYFTEIYSGQRTLLWEIIDNDDVLKAVEALEGDGCPKGTMFLLLQGSKVALRGSTFYAELKEEMTIRIKTLADYKVREDLLENVEKGKKSIRKKFKLFS